MANQQQTVSQQRYKVLTEKDVISTRHGNHIVDENNNWIGFINAKDEERFFNPENVEINPTGTKGLLDRLKAISHELDEEELDAMDHQEAQVPDAHDYPRLEVIPKMQDLLKKQSDSYVKDFAKGLREQGGNLADLPQFDKNDMAFVNAAFEQVKKDYQQSDEYRREMEKMEEKKQTQKSGKVGNRLNEATEETVEASTTPDNSMHNETGAQFNDSPLNDAEEHNGSKQEKVKGKAGDEKEEEEKEKQQQMAARQEARQSSFLESIMGGFGELVGRASGTAMNLARGSDPRSPKNMLNRGFGTELEFLYNKAGQGVFLGKELHDSAESMDNSLRNAPVKESFNVAQGEAKQKVCHKQALENIANIEQRAKGINEKMAEYNKNNLIESARHVKSAQNTEGVSPETVQQLAANVEARQQQAGLTQEAMESMKNEASELQRELQKQQEILPQANLSADELKHFQDVTESLSDTIGDMESITSALELNVAEQSEGEEKGKFAEFMEEVSEQMRKLSEAMQEQIAAIMAMLGMKGSGQAATMGA